MDTIFKIQIALLCLLVKERDRLRYLTSSSLFLPSAALKLHPSLTDLKNNADFIILSFHQVNVVNAK